MNIENLAINNSLKQSVFFSDMESAEDGSTKQVSCKVDLNSTLSDGDTGSIDSLTVYLNQVWQIELLTAQEEIHYAKLAQRGNREAAQKLVVSNLRLVVYFAKQYAYKGMLLVDLIQEGNIGLMKAVNKFDPTLNYRFSTYASWCIRQQMQQALTDQSRLIRLPAHIIKSQNKCRKAEREFAKQDKGRPNDEQLANLMEETVKKVRIIKTLNDIIVPVDLLSININNDENYEAKVAVNDDPYMAIKNDQHTLNFHQWIGKLEEKEAEIIVRRFGLQGHKAQTLEEVGLAVDMSREKVRKVQIVALGRLKRMMEQEGLTKEEMLF